MEAQKGRKEDIPQAPSPTMTSLRRSSDMTCRTNYRARVRNPGVDERLGWRTAMETRPTWAWDGRGSIQGASGGLCAS